MKKFVIAALLFAFFASAVAEPMSAGTSGSAGINLGSKNEFGIQGEFSISSLAEDAPVSVQIFWKSYLQDVAAGASWDTTGVGAAVIFDFNTVARMDKEIHPYAGAGLISVSNKWRGAGPAQPYFGVSSGLYFTAGIRYGLTPQVSVDLNYNFFSDLTIGMNFNF